jgi:hypothetical protein
MTTSEIGLVDDAQVASDVLLPVRRDRDRPECRGPAVRGGLVRRSGGGLRSLNRSGRRPCAGPGAGRGRHGAGSGAWRLICPRVRGRGESR